MRVKRDLPSSGFTLVELTVTMGVMAIVGLLIFLVLNTGMILYAQNTVVNTSQQQARSAIDQMLQSIHSAVSIPQLMQVVTSGQPSLQPVGGPVSGTGAAGVSFQVFDAGPFPVVADAAATATSLTLNCPGYIPPTGARLNIPSYNIELDIASTSAAGANRKINFAQSIGTLIDVAGTGVEGGSKTYYVITAFITTRKNYAVIQTSPSTGSPPPPFVGELRSYPDPTDLTNYTVVARNLTSPTPFSIPTTPLQNRYVEVDLSSADPGYNKIRQLKNKPVGTFIAAKIPYLVRLTNLQ